MHKDVKLSKLWKFFEGQGKVIPTIHQYKERMITSSDEDIAAHNRRVEADKELKRRNKGKS